MTKRHPVKHSCPAALRELWTANRSFFCGKLRLRPALNADKRIRLAPRQQPEVVPSSPSEA